MMKALLVKIWRLLGLPKNAQLSIMRLSEDQFLIGVMAIIFNQKNEILLFKHTYRKNNWALPSGYLKAKEHPKEGLEREIEEESDLIVSIDEQFKIRTDRETARLEICCIGTYIGGEFKRSAEVSQALFFSFDNLPHLPKDQLFLIHKALDYKNSLQRVDKVPLTETHTVQEGFLGKFRRLLNPFM